VIGASLMLCVGFLAVLVWGPHIQRLRRGRYEAAIEVASELC
jgi:hypothetical protein